MTHAGNAVLARLLDELPKREIEVARDPTFLEIPGRSHLENVLAAYLEFFLDPGREHGVGTLFASAFLHAATRGAVREVDPEARIEREVVTVDRKRIDLIIVERNQNRVSKIEFKIYAHLHNDLHAYDQYWPGAGFESDDAWPERAATQRINRVVAPANRLPAASSLVGEFESLAISDWMREVRSRLGDHVETANQRYWPMLIDVITTLESFEMTNQAPSQFEMFFVENGEHAASLSLLLKQLADLKKQFVIDLDDVIAEINSRFDSKVSWGVWGVRNMSDRVVRFADFTSNGEKAVRVDVIRMPGGWNLRLAPYAWQKSFDGMVHVVADRGEFSKYSESRRQRIHPGFEEHGRELHAARAEDVAAAICECLEPLGLDWG